MDSAWSPLSRPRAVDVPRDFAAITRERMRQGMPRYDGKTVGASEPPRDPSAARVVGRDLQPYAVAVGDPDAVDVQSAAPLGQDRPAVDSRLELDRVKATSAALRDDSLENEEITVTRTLIGTCIHRQSVPRFEGGYMGLRASSSAAGSACGLF